MCCVLQAHRNLCEDYLSIATVPPEHVAICADIELTADADIELVQARVFHAIEQYFNPPIPYYTLKELLGHSTIEMTQRYAHLVNGALRKAACVADEVF